MYRQQSYFLNVQSGFPRLLDNRAVGPTCFPANCCNCYECCRPPAPLAYNTSNNNHATSSSMSGHGPYNKRPRPLPPQSLNNSENYYLQQQQYRCFSPLRKSHGYDEFHYSTSEEEEEAENMHPQQRPSKRPRLRGVLVEHQPRPRRVVAFDEAKNKVHFLDRPNIMDSQTKHKLWYNGSDFAKFYASVRASRQALSHSFCTQTLADAFYRHSDQDVRHRLAQLYAEADDLVGLEYHVLLPACRADLTAQKQALRGAVRQTSKSTTASRSSKERHLHLLSQKFSKRSQRFVQEIALAQSRALAWMPPV